MLATTKSVEALATRCHAAHMGKSNYADAGQWHFILLSARKLLGKDENGNLPSESAPSKSTVDSNRPNEDSGAASDDIIEIVDQDEEGEVEEVTEIAVEGETPTSSNATSEQTTVTLKDGTVKALDNVFCAGAMHELGIEPVKKRIVDIVVADVEEGIEETSDDDEVSDNHE